MDRRYDRGAEDMREYVARLLERHGGEVGTDGFGVVAAVVRALPPKDVRAAMEADSAYMRKVAEREVEHTRQGWRERQAAYQDRQRRLAAGEQLPPVQRGPKRKRST